MLPPTPPLTVLLHRNTPCSSPSRHVDRITHDGGFAVCDCHVSAAREDVRPAGCTFTSSSALTSAVTVDMRMLPCSRGHCHPLSHSHIGIVDTWVRTPGHAEGVLVGAFQGGPVSARQAVRSIGQRQLQLWARALQEWWSAGSSTTKGDWSSRKSSG